MRCFAALGLEKAQMDSFSSHLPTIDTASISRKLLLYCRQETRVHGFIVGAAEYMAVCMVEYMAEYIAGIVALSPIFAGTMDTTGTHSVGEPLYRKTVC